jgi:mRNA degradation ribonuclease J1/J2
MQPSYLFKSKFAPVYEETVSRQMLTLEMYQKKLGLDDEQFLDYLIENKIEVYNNEIVILPLGD